MKKWKLMNKIMHINNQPKKDTCKLFNPLDRNHVPDENELRPREKVLRDIQKEILSNKSIVLLNSYSEKFMKGKYDELTLVLTIKKVNKLVKHINKIVPESNKIDASERPICLKIIKTYLANLNIIVNYLNLNAINKKTQTRYESLAKSSAEVLSNKEKLLQYLKEMSSPSILPLVVTAPLLHIRHEYAKYHKLYGVPEKMNYDLGKLNKILEHE
jgi:hypothetical protein